MAAGVRTVKIRFDGSTRGLDKAAARGQRAMDRFKRGLAVAARAAGVALLAVGAGAALLAKSSVQAASDLEESLNKARVVFGRAAASVERFAATAAAKLGLSRQAALEAASAFGNLFRTTGLAREPAAKMSRVMVKLASDMASFNNEDPSAMLERLQSGLAGEAEPLRRFGVLLSEARVKAFAYKTGIAETGEELTEAQKVQARYGLILKDTAAQQGDFARTSGSLANKQRILAARFEDLKAKLGEKLLPVVTQLADKALKFLTWVEEKGIPAVKDFADTWGKKLAPWLEKGKQLLEDLFGEDVRAGFRDLKQAWDDVREVLKDPDVQTALKTLAVLFGVTLLVAIKFVVAQFRLAAFILKTFLAPAIKFFAVITKTQMNIVLSAVEAFLRALKFVIDIAAKIPGPHQKAFKSMSKSIEGAIGKVKGLRDWINRIPTARNFKLTMNEKSAIASLKRIKVAIQGVRRDAQLGIVVPVQGGGRLTERAHGGPVRAGRSYLVGERGPELLTMTGGGSGFVSSAGETREALGGGVFEGNLFLDSGEFLGKVRGVVKQANRDLKRRALAGAGAAA